MHRDMNEELTCDGQISNDLVVGLEKINDLQALILATNDRGDVCVLEVVQRTGVDRRLAQAGASRRVSANNVGTGRDCGRHVVVVVDDLL